MNNVGIQGMCSVCVFSWMGCYCFRLVFVLIEHVLLKNLLYLLTIDLYIVVR